MMNTTDDSIIESVEGCIKVIRLNKPKKKNAIDCYMYQQITKILNDSAMDSDILMVVLTGTGDFYSSGNDFVSTLKISRTGENNTLNDVLKDFIKAFIMFPKLLIAIVNGPAIGVAATTLSLCDLVFAAEHSYFYTPFTKLGIVAEGCSTYTFPKLIGERKAIEMLIFNYKMPAQEALSLGFVNCVYKPEEIQNKVWDKLAEISQLPKHSLLACRKLIKNKNRRELLETNENEMKELAECWKHQVRIETRSKL